MKKVLNNKINDNYKYVSLVLGSGESALGIVRSLSADKKIKIILIGKDNLANNSRYIHEFFKVNTYDEAELDQYFNKIIFNYKNLIIYPSGNDFWVNYLLKKKKLLKNKKIVENTNLVNLMNKNYQFDLCSRLNIPHPKSIKIKKTNQINQIKKLNLPLIIKPEERNTLKEDFRNIFIDESNINQVMFKFKNKFGFIVSEFIEGDDKNLFTFGSYCMNGKIIDYFIGKKLTQKPTKTGTAGLAQNVLEPDKRIKKYSSKILSNMNFTGISQIEYKYSEVNDEFYFIEINPRSWLWIYLSTACGVNLPLTQYYFEASISQNIEKKKDQKKNYLFISGKSIITNILKEKNFKSIELIKDKAKFIKVYPVFNLLDPKPFINSILKIIKKKFVI